jgi:hypothetical protein
MKSIYILSIALLSLIWVGCERDPEPPVVFVLPGALNIPTNGGELIEFDIDLLAGDNPLSSFRIIQKPLNGLTSIVLDTTITGQQSSFFYIYEVPIGDEDIIVTFTALDSEGYEGETARRLALQGNNFLPESSGHTLYSRYSNAGNNAFNLDDSSPQFLATDPDSMFVDLMEIDPTNDSTLSNSWSSLSGVKYVRNNSFNYPEATQAAAENTFISSTPIEVISNLEEDDILIAEYEIDSAVYNYAVIKITSILDQEGSDGDRYIFNLKK